MSLNKTTALFFALLTSSGAFAGPNTFVYQGRLTDLSGNPVLDASASLKLQVFNPSKTCLLYEETQTVDTDSTSGHFLLQVGSGVSNAKRSGDDPNLPMETVFKNNGTVGPYTGCPGGYTPAATDIRYLRVIVTSTAGTEPLSPDQVLASTPFATTAQTLQGKGPLDFIANTIGGMQAALEELVNGTSALYVRADGSNISAPTSNNGQRLTGVAAPSAGTDAVNKTYADTKVGGREISAAVPGAGQVLVWDSANTRWEPGSATDNSVDAHARVSPTVCGVGQASAWDGVNWICVSAGGPAGGGATTHPGATGSVVLTNASPKLHKFGYTDGGAFTLPDATTMSLGGPLFSFMNSSSDPIVLFNSSGGFVAGLGTAAGVIDVYLSDKTTADGKWEIGSGATGWAVEKTVKTTTMNFPGSLYIQEKLHQKLAANSFLGIAQSGPDFYAFAYTIDPINKTATWGTPVNLGTDYIDKLVVLSSGKALALSNSDARVLDIAGNTVTANALQPSVTCGAVNPYVVAGALEAHCFWTSAGSFYGKKLNISGGTVTPTSYTTLNGVSGSPSAVGALALSSTLAVVYVSGWSVGDNGLYSADLANLTFGATFGQLSSGNIQYGMSPNTPAAFKVSTTSGMIGFGNSSPNASKFGKFTADATGVTVDSVQTVYSGSGAGGYSPWFYLDGSFIFDSGSGRTKVPITSQAAATPTIGAMSKGMDCAGGVPYAPGKCVLMQHYVQGAGDNELRLNFLVTY